MKVGDIVKLKSQQVIAPRMTVNKLDQYHKTVECLWFDINFVLYEGTFAIEAVVKQEDETNL